MCRDVAQGDLFCDFAEGSTLLIDGEEDWQDFVGAKGREEFRADREKRRVVVGYLWSRGIQRLDAVR